MDVSWDNTWEEFPHLGQSTILCPHPDGVTLVVLVSETILGLSSVAHMSISWVRICKYNIMLPHDKPASTQRTFVKDCVINPWNRFYKRSQNYYFNSDPQLTGEAAQNSKRKLALVSPNWPHGIGLDKMMPLLLICTKMFGPCRRPWNPAQPSRTVSVINTHTL